jgi:hypothetical protein
MPGRSQGGSSGGHARYQGKGAKLSFNYDSVADVLLIEGIRYSGDVFRRLAQPDDGCLHRLVQENGLVIIAKCEADSA